MADITTTKRIIELPDASQTITNDDYFAIDNANGDTGKIPASLFTSTSREADQYDPEETYAVGDLCINNNVLYRCTTAISTAEVWTPAHWTQTTLANEISTLNSSLTDTITTNVILSDIGTTKATKQVTAYKIGRVYVFSTQFALKNISISTVLQVSLPNNYVFMLFNAFLRQANVTTGYSIQKDNNNLYFREPDGHGAITFSASSTDSDMLQISAVILGS